MRGVHTRHVTQATQDAQQKQAAVAAILPSSFPIVRSVLATAQRVERRWKFSASLKDLRSASLEISQNAFLQTFPSRFEVGWSVIET